MENIDNIADYFIWFANEHGDLITHLKLQKLCYFAEAFYLAKNKKPLKHGRMDLYQEHCGNV